MGVLITPAAAAGPYQTEAETLTEVMPQQLQGSGLVTPGDPDRIRHNIKYVAMVNACHGAGVELGKYDARILGWLANSEESVCQVLIGLVARAYASGLRDGAE